MVGVIGQLRGTLPGEFQGIEVFRMTSTTVSTAEAHLSGRAEYTGLMDAQHAMVGIKEVERFFVFDSLVFRYVEYLLALAVVLFVHFCICAVATWKCPFVVHQKGKKSMNGKKRFLTLFPRSVADSNILFHVETKVWLVVVAGPRSRVILGSGNRRLSHSPSVRTRGLLRSLAARVQDTRCCMYAEAWVSRVGPFILNRSHCVIPIYLFCFSSKRF